MSAEELATLRARIDELDRAWIDVLARRFEATRAVGRIKAATASPARDPERERQQRARTIALAEETGVPPELAMRVLDAILETVIREHVETGAS